MTIVPAGSGAFGASLGAPSGSSVIVTTISGTPTTTTMPPKSPQSGSSGPSSRPGQSSSSGQPQGTTRPSGPAQSSTTSQASAAAQTTIPSPTIAAGSMVTEGATAVLGLIPLAKAVQKGMDKAQKAITTLNQANSPNSDDVNGVLGVLASAYAILTLLEKEAGMINTNSLPEDIKKIVENIKKALPKINKGTSDTIDNLKNSIKDPKKINKDDLNKAEQLLGRQGSTTGQVTQALKPLTDWKPPKGNDDIILRGILTMPSPSVGDNWKGTTIPGTLTVPSPTLHWDQNIMDDHGGSGSNSGNGGGNGGGNGWGGGGGGFFSGLFNLAKQAEGAVDGAANALNHLSGLSDISFNDVSNVVSQLTSAAQGQSVYPTLSLFSTDVTTDVGGLGAGFDGIELDTFAPADITRIVEAQNANRALYSDIRETLNSVVQFINQPPQALQLIKREAPKWVIGGTILGLMGKSGSSSINSFPSTKVTSTSSQPAAPTESDKVVNEYFLVTVPDTPVKAFQAWIKGLPDKGAGVQEHYDWPRVYQTYLTRMTQQEAEVVNGDLIVGHIAPNQMEVIFHDHVRKDHLSVRSQRTSNETRLETRDLPAVQLWRRYGSALHLRMLSTSAIGLVGQLQHTLDDPQFDYVFEETAGAGAHVYVYDGGFLLNHQVSLFVPFVAAHHAVSSRPRDFHAYRRWSCA